MELEEMKTLWEKMSERVEKLELVNEQHIMEMTQQKYTKKFSKLFIYESMGSVICFAMAIFLLVNIEKLDTWYLLACGIFTIGILLVLPYFTLQSLSKIKRLNVSKYSYKETLVRFEKSKNRILLLQRGGIVLSFGLALLILPVLQKILNNKDFFANDMSGFPWISVSVMLVFLFFFARWGYGCYKSITNSAENVLKELED